MTNFARSMVRTASAFALAAAVALAAAPGALAQQKTLKFIPQADLRSMAREFDILIDVPATPDETELARQTFMFQAQRRAERYAYEAALWRKAVTAGVFLGALLVTLTFTSLFMCVVTGRDQTTMPIICLTFVVAQSITTFVCLKGWHQR